MIEGAHVSIDVRNSAACTPFGVTQRLRGGTVIGSHLAMLLGIGLVLFRRVGEPRPARPSRVTALLVLDASGRIVGRSMRVGRLLMRRSCLLVLRLAHVLRLRAGCRSAA